MAKEKRSRPETVDYVAKILKAKPDTAYADIVKAGKKDGYHIYPLIMGIAKNTVGLGRPKATTKKRGPGRPKGRGPGRPPGSGTKTKPAMGRGFTAELVRGLDRMQNDIAAMRDALHQIAKLSARF